MSAQEAMACALRRACKPEGPIVLKRIVCLANSRKLAGRCLAGRELINGALAGWIRPVSAREHEEVSEYERLYENGSDPQVLDIIDIPMIKAKARSYQPENWLLDSKLYWEKVGAVQLADLPRFVDEHSLTWANGNHTFNGVNDYVPADQVGQLDSSLRLIHLRDGLQLNVYSPGEAFGNGKRRVQAEFTFDDVEYHLWVTDPLIEREYLAQDNGRYSLGARYLTISLGEPYDGRHYKLVAAIIGGD